MLHGNVLFFLYEEKDFIQEKKEHYNVTFAHTDRFRRSPTLTMQRLTNQDHQDNLQ